MPSPFPGMAPYLEDPAFWSDFHHRFITYWCDAINERLPDHYEARIDERVVMDEPEGPSKAIEPDVAVLRDEPRTPTRPGGPAVATLEPVTVPLLLLDQPHQLFIEVRRRPGRELVAVLVLLSPSNKAGPDRVAYLAKREALIHREVHLVELDLLLKGQRLPMDGPLPPGQYYAFVARAERRPDCEVYAWTLRDPLPTLPLPLKPPDPDIPLDLAAVFATAYERGRYARSIDYAAPPPVALDDDDARWARERAGAAAR